MCWRRLKDGRDGLSGGGGEFDGGGVGCLEGSRVEWWTCCGRGVIVRLRWLGVGVHADGIDAVVRRRNGIVCGSFVNIFGAQYRVARADRLG
jgi:hypothetical protein